MSNQKNQNNETVQDRVIEILDKTLSLLRYVNFDDDEASVKPDIDLAEIKNKMEEYIKTHCKHTIVYDLIDLTPDTSKTIRYCIKCSTDFPV
jgi:hypothetical protein